MGIKDLAKKVLKRGGDSEEDIFDEFDDEVKEDLAGPSPAPKEESEESFNDEMDSLDEPEETAPSRRMAAPQNLHPEPPAPSQDISRSLQNLGERLRFLESKLDQTQSKLDLQKTEFDRCIQFLSLINEKIDHLEREHSELERLIQER